MNLKNKFPFRLGTSSYIIPDNIIPNVKYLSDKVDDIEILLFESDEISNLPNTATIKEMNKIAKENNLSYNIHLPVDIVLGATNETIRKNSVQKCIRVIELMQNVNPIAYILHLTGNPNIMGTGTTETIKDWLPSFNKSLNEITSRNIDPSLICIETLKYPFYYLDNLIDKFNLSVCLDVGHILIYKHSLEEYFNKYLEKTKVIHLHGIKNGKDHNHIGYLDTSVLNFVIKSIMETRKKEKILTLEIFNEEDFNNSIKQLEKYL
jgi:sugar phosphate isomerase/epimerase